MIKFSLLLIILIAFLGCLNKAKGYSSTDFKSFFQNYNTDSNFQKSSITFPLIVFSDSVAIMKIEKEEWVFTPLLSEEKKIVKIATVSKDSIIVNYSIEDTGIFVEHHFARKDGQWNLVKIIDNSD